MKQIEGHVFYLAFGYFISYLPHTLLAKALSIGVVPGAARPVGGLVLLSVAALGQLPGMVIVLGVSGWSRFAGEQRIAAYAVLQEAGVIPHRHRSPPLTAELCRQADVIYCTMAEHRAAVLALPPDAADRTHCPAERDIAGPSAVSLDDHGHTAVLIQQAVANRLAEQFL